MPAKIGLVAMSSPLQFKFRLLYDDDAKAGLLGALEDEGVFGAPDPQLAPYLKKALQDLGWKAFVEQEDRELFVGAVLLNEPLPQDQVYTYFARAWHRVCMQHVDLDAAPQSDASSPSAVHKCFKAQKEDLDSPVELAQCLKSITDEDCNRIFGGPPQPDVNFSVSLERDIKILPLVTFKNST
jgi:hypothetical protein